MSEQLQIFSTTWITHLTSRFGSSSICSYDLIQGPDSFEWFIVLISFLKHANMYSRRKQKGSAQKYYKSSIDIYNDKKNLVTRDQHYVHQSDLKKFSSLLANSIDELRYKQDPYISDLFRTSFYVVDTVIPIVREDDENLTSDYENTSLYIDTYYYPRTSYSVNTKFWVYSKTAEYTEHIRFFHTNIVEPKVSHFFGFWWWELLSLETTIAFKIQRIFMSKNGHTCVSQCKIRLTCTLTAVFPTHSKC